MNTLIVTCGIPGCGKTTWAEKQKDQYLIFDSDKIRKELYGDESVQTNPAYVFSIMRERTLAALKEGKNVIYCATNINTNHRKQLITFIRKYASSVRLLLVIFNLNLETCLERNFARERHVPEYVINRMYTQLIHNYPSITEGWDEIIEIV